MILEKEFKFENVNLIYLCAIYVKIGKKEMKWKNETCMRVMREERKIINCKIKTKPKPALAYCRVWMRMS